MLATLPVGFCFGAVEISLPAFAEEHGAREWPACCSPSGRSRARSAGSPTARARWPRPLAAIYLCALRAAAARVPARARAPSIAAMALLILPAGLLIAPLGAAGNQLVGAGRPGRRGTEAYAWPVTAMIAGFAAGAAIGGVLVEAVDWRACFVARR